MAIRKIHTSSFATDYGITYRIFGLDHEDGAETIMIERNGISDARRSAITMVDSGYETAAIYGPDGWLVEKTTRSINLDHFPRWYYK